MQDSSISAVMLHGNVGYWDEIGTAVALVSIVVLAGFLAWSSGNKRRQAQRERRLRKQSQKRQS